MEDKKEINVSPILPASEYLKYDNYNIQKHDWTLQNKKEDMEEDNPTFKDFLNQSLDQYRRGIFVPKIKRLGK